MSECNAFLVGILTVSDRCASGLMRDQSGPALKKVAQRHRWVVRREATVPDEKEQIQGVLEEWIYREKIHLILTSGGTGVGPRDVTPEATRRVIEKEVPGLGELMRREGEKQNPFALLSRAVAGIREESLILNLPGNPQGAVESLAAVLPLIPHVFHMIQGHGHPDREEVC